MALDIGLDNINCAIPKQGQIFCKKKATLKNYGFQIYRYFSGSALSSRFSQGYISPRRRVALIENGSLSHASPTYLATSPHYHANGSPRTGPPIDIMDDFIEYVDPVLQPRPLPVIPPQILSAYHHGRF